MRWNMKAASVATALLPCALVIGCAGNEVRSPAAFTEAQAMIEQAERADAQRYASRELNMARQKLNQARAAQDDGDEELAQRLATHAQLDAQLAAATADNQDMQAAVQELRASLDTLRSEIERGQRSNVQ